MMIFKKKEIIACALVALIGVAGYLNWSYQDTIRVADGESYLEQVKKLGEAEFVSSDQNGVEEESMETAVTTGEYFTEAKMSKDNARSKACQH